MRRIALWAVGLLIGLPLLLVALVFIGLNIGPGRVAAEGLIARVTGGQVVIAGLQGRFPDALRVAHLEVHDADGAWLLADDVALDWSPTRLPGGVASIDRLEAARIQVPRLPLPGAPAAASGKPFTLPVTVDVRRLAVARIEIGAGVIGVPAVLAASGGAHVPSLDAGQADLVLHRLDGPGDYALHAVIDPARIEATLDATEPPGGLIARLASLPDIGALGIKVAMTGKRDAVVTTAELGAGPLRIGAHGTIDLVHQAATMDVSATAPAMTPRADVSWQGITLQAHVAGPFTTPDATGQLRVDRLMAGGAGVQSLVADIQGNGGQVHLHAAADRVRLPPPAGLLLESDPVLLDADIRLNEPARPVTFAVNHPLLRIAGRAQTGGDFTATADVALDRLAPFAALFGVDLQGRTALSVKAALAGGVTRVDADGTLSLDSGPAPAPALVGVDAPIGVSVQLAGSDITLTRLDFAGRALSVSVTGKQEAGVLDSQVRVGLKDLAVLAPTVSGAAQVDAHVQGPTDALAVTLHAAGEVGAPGVPRGPVTLDADIKGLPNAPTGAITASGVLAGAPLSLSIQARREADGALHATIDRADWQSLHAEGALTLPPGATLPQGRIGLRMTRLADVNALLHQSLAGSIVADVVLERDIRLKLDATNAGVPGSRVGHATVEAHVTDPTGHPAVTAHVVADGIDAAGTTGSARVDIAGPQEALAVRTTAALGIGGTDTQITGAAVVNAVSKLIQLSALQVAAKGETVRLLAPAQIRLADGVTVDRLRLGVRQAVLEVAGRLSPTLDATATLRTPADIAAAFAPEAAADGTIALDAKLTGTPAQPGGSVRLVATGLRARTGPGRALPAANLNATATLAGGAAQVEARLVAGSAAQLSVNGRVPLGAGPLDLRSTGMVDLTLLDPILGSAGRRARGRVQLDAGIAGTTASPRVTGTAQLTGGEIQDFAQGVRVTDIAATLRAEGDTVRIVSFTGRAGPGTIGVTGSIGVLSPTLPLDLTVQMRNARPLASDRLTANLDADITLRGPATGALQAAGKVVVRTAEIRIPERLPASIAVLNVRRPGQRPPPPAPPSAIGLDLTIEAPRAIFVRGRGVDAELSGTLRVRGSSLAPQVGGGFEMRRGTISVAGTVLTFSRGKVGFDGTGVTGKIDPTLDFAADSTAAGVTATLAITGYASAPKIKLSSVPDLPQDEVLAYLLFKRSAKELGPFQLAEIAAAVASLTGVGGGGLNPLESVRKGLGLDRLSVGQGATGNAPSIEAGRYVGNGVYVGAKQGTTGGQTQATVQIDITKGLKLQTDVGTGTGGNSVGLTYQFEY